jgi:putative glutamine amidotransferase
MQNRAYLDRIAECGCVPLPIPPGPPGQLRVLYDFCDGVCLAGGKDVDPRSYGRPPVTSCETECQPELDRAEFTLARWARHDRLPLLGICRGPQVLNVALGGTLWQDLPTQAGLHGHGGGEAESTTEHDVLVDGASRLGQILRADRARVNSRHHQAVRRLGHGLRASAHATDGTVEAIEADGDWFAVAVQWHPEQVPGPEHGAALFDALAAAAAR